MATSLQALIEEKLGRNLEAFVSANRLDGRSWRYIANAIRDDTGVDLADETLRQWFGLDADEVSA